jgi:predicted DNA-binding ribbon-helix-helix protein
MSRMAKRSITIAGHRTSVSIEEPFWQALGDIAAERGMSLAALIADIDRTRPTGSNLSSAIRLSVLEWYRQDAAERDTGKSSRTRPAR